MNAKEHFFHLTPDVILGALDKAGFSPTGHMLQLNSLENRVFSLLLEDGSYAVMKFYRPGRWTKEQILEEHAYTAQCAAQDVPVCAPVTLSNNSTIMETDGIFFAVWNKTGGRIPEEFSDEMLHSIGRTIARMHNVGASKKFEKRMTMSAEYNLLSPASFLKEKSFIPKNLIPRFETSVNALAEMFDTSIEKIPLHRIHGDCHWGNLLCDHDRFFFLDFDDSVTGPAVQDIWMIAPAQDELGIIQRDILLEGYRQFRPFEHRWLSAIVPLRGARYVYYAAWIARRLDDPSFQRAFPQFGTEDYWEQEILDLETLIREGNPDMKDKLPPEEMLLADEDYFFDMK